MIYAPDEEFSKLIEKDTIYDEGGWFDYRYFDTGADPGKEVGGLVVFDFFITAGSSGHVVTGDGEGRDFAAPFSADTSESRVRVVEDKATGRGVVIQNDTELVGAQKGLAGPLGEEEPRPIVVSGNGLLRDYEPPTTSASRTALVA